MKTNYDVARLIKYIKTLPIAVALIFSLTVTYLVLHNNIEKHEENIKNIKEDFMSKEKLLIKEEVTRTVRHIKYQKNLAETNLKHEIKMRVETVYNIIEHIYKENQYQTKEEITKSIKDAIRTMRFNDGRGYFFIYTLSGKNILFPTSPELEGDNMWNLKDSDGKYSIRRLAKIAKEQGEGFLSWNWYKPSNDGKYNQDMYKKIGYVKYIKELDWFVGTGEYLEEFENKIKKELIKEIQQIRYGKNGFISIHQYDGLTLAHINEKEIGKYRLNVQNSEGDYPIQEMIEVAKKGEGYVKCFACINPLSNEKDQKLSYVYGLQDWGWKIASGTYLSEIDDMLVKQEIEFKEKLYSSIITIVISSILLTLLLIYIMLKLLTIIENEFGKYEKALSDHMIESNRKDKILSEQAKLASMGEMIANIAHQWRQPLSVISTAATGMKMQKEYDCLSPDAFNNSCDAINNNAQYLSETIEDFKNFIKGDQVEKVFSLSSTIKKFLHLIENSTKAHDINIELDLDDTIKINGHENELVQCFMNLFNNSKDALEERKQENKKFFIKTFIVDDQVKIEVRDNAGGITSDIINKIFEPYFTTKHKSQGTGLGLHMTYNLIVDGMKGTINVQNDEKFSGALFTISLPLN